MGKRERLAVGVHEAVHGGPGMEGRQGGGVAGAPRLDHGLGLQRALGRAHPVDGGDAELQAGVHGARDVHLRVVALDATELLGEQAP